MGQIAQLLVGGPGVALGAREDARGPSGAIDHRRCMCDPQVVGQGQQSLLGSVVQIPLDAPTFCVAAGHDSLPRELQLTQARQ